MGEIAEMMFDGTLCEGCGGYIDDDGGFGVPRYCSDACARGRGALEDDQQTEKWFQCSLCQKRFRYRKSVEQHTQDAHGGTKEPPND